MRSSCDRCLRMLHRCYILCALNGVEREFSQHPLWFYQQSTHCQRAGTRYWLERNMLDFVPVVVEGVGITLQNYTCTLYMDISFYTCTCSLPQARTHPETPNMQQPRFTHTHKHEQGPQIMLQIIILLCWVTCISRLCSCTCKQLLFYTTGHQFEHKRSQHPSWTYSSDLKRITENGHKQQQNNPCMQ